MDVELTAIRAALSMRPAQDKEHHAALAKASAQVTVLERAAKEVLDSWEVLGEPTTQSLAELREAVDAHLAAGEPRA